MIFNICCAVLTIASFIVTFIAVGKWQKAEKFAKDLIDDLININKEGKW